MKNTETNIIKGIRAGRESAFEELFNEYYRPLSVFGLKYVKDLEIAKEIVQNLFVHLYDNRQTLLITSSLESYLYQSVRNRCLNQIKQEQTHKKHLDQYQSEQDEAEDMEARLRETELEHRIFKIIESLPPQCRNIFTLSRVQGLSNAEIAEKLEISKRTVETQISNALKVLRSKLTDLTT
ncbi:MAG: RNA polymerase sigma-70 factor [Bacteroidetes bacterium]|nr:RNA polymerase sigma-70 factor [Bacteroidota bacterium]